MTDRDHFAAAALTGLLCNGDYSMESIPRHAFSMADAMLRERDKTSADKTTGSGSVTLTDADREAVEAALAYMAPVGHYDSRVQNTLRGMLERLA